MVFEMFDCVIKRDKINNSIHCVECIKYLVHKLQTTMLKKLLNTLKALFIFLFDQI